MKAEVQSTCGPAARGRSGLGRTVKRPTRRRVWGLRTGTHDLAPITRSFNDEAAARTYANQQWRNR